MKEEENMMHANERQTSYVHSDDPIPRPKFTTFSKTTFLSLLGCVLLATAFNGLSGSGMDRALIEMPAWQHVGALAWAAFSRWADLGTNGLILYPLEKIGGTVFSVGAALIFFVNRRRLPRSGTLPIYGAALCAFGAMLATTQAAPLMMSTAHLSDPIDLLHALDGFTFWESVRAGVQALTFCGNLWALVVVSRLYPANSGMVA